MKSRTGVFAVTFALLPLAAAAGDYVGTLKLPKAGIPAPGALYSFASLFQPAAPATAFAPAERPLRLKLGYQYSRYFSLEGELNDVARPPADLFSTTDPSASPFRASQPTKSSTLCVRACASRRNMSISPGVFSPRGRRLCQYRFQIQIDSP